MNAPLQDDPRSYIAEARRKALVDGQQIPDTVDGSGLFADISGFTPLTEALASTLGAKRGAEALVDNLNRILEALIGDLHRFGGEVIYFSGDAITCWIDDDDGAAAVSCALQMQRTMAEIGHVEVGGEDVVLSLKVAVATGSARRFVVGDPELQLIEVLAGSLIDDLAAAEQVAERGDCILAPSTSQSLGQSVSVSEFRSGDDGRQFGVLESVAAPVPPGEAFHGFEDLSTEVARSWLLPTVFERLSIGGGAMFAELRTVLPVFIRFGGIDFDSDPEAPAKLKTFVRTAQGILDRFGGSLLQLTLGDKGAYLYAVFGSPQAHEDDSSRAVRAASEIHHAVEGTDVIDVQIGISRGRVLSGTCGHPQRRTFACLGDPVNLAARLMGKAEPGAVLVTADVVEAAGPLFVWAGIPPLQLKGKAAPVEAYVLSGLSRETRKTFTRFPLPLVGRTHELSIIQGRLHDATRGQRNVVGVTAEPGMGKSRLVAEIVDTLGEVAADLAYGEAESFGTTTSYLVWRDVWRSLLDLDVNPAAATVTDRIRALDERLAPRAPLVAALVGADIPDNEITSLFDPKLRKTSLESLASSMLSEVVDDGPVVIVLEDCHWIDEASIDLLEVLVRDSASLPILFVIAYRTEIAPAARDRLLQLPTFEELRLAELTGDEMREAIGTKLVAQFGAEVIASPAVIDLVMARSEGNPFVIEELINFLHRKSVDIADPRSVRDLDIPESLQAMVLQRVDALEAHPRRALKVGSVVGSEFEAASLPPVYPALGNARDVIGFLEYLGSAELVARDGNYEDWWLFRHAVTREVAYESIPFGLRSQLHEAVGSYLESREESIDLDRLAYHYWNSENHEKKVDYQRRAAEAAQASYSNAAAIEYYERLLTVVDEAGRSSALSQFGEVLELVGEWSRAQEAVTESLALTRAAGDVSASGWNVVALAEIARKQGRFDDARDQLDQAQDLFGSIADRAGTGRVLHLAGTLAAQGGDLDSARSFYEESLEIRRALDDQSGAASLLSNLGVVAEYGGQLDGARSFHEQALEARQSVGDRWAIAVSNTNLGMIEVLSGDFERARDLFSEAMRLNEEVGDAWMVAVSHNNLGNAYRDLGDGSQARHHYRTSAKQYLPYADRWATAFLLEDIAVQLALDDLPQEAVTLLGAADHMRSEIDSPRADSLAEILETRVVGRSRLDEEEVANARTAGRSLSLDAALNRAIVVLEG